MRRVILILTAIFTLAGTTLPGLAVDPPYQAQLERLTKVMGSLHYLHPLCGHEEIDWRLQAADLIDLDQPDEDRRSRLVGAFNDGYRDFARLHQRCGAAEMLALERFLTEAETLSREIHARFAE
jgi:uncharacterized protein (TIGR02301 family)